MPIRGSLRLVVDRQRRDLDAFLHDEALEASRLTRREVRARTPIGTRFDPRTGVPLGPSGDLRDSVDEIMPFKSASDVWVGGAESELDYASHVEFGTRAHIIRAYGDGWLRFWSAGQIRFAKQVNHPGAPGHFMFQRGLYAAYLQHRAGADGRLQRFLDSRGA